MSPSPEIDSIIAATSIKINHVEGSNAYYVPKTDEVYMPEQSSFLGTPTSTAFESYYGVLLHECVHATGAQHRLNRDLTTSRNTDDYAFEELVAELLEPLSPVQGLAFLQHPARITPTTSNTITTC